MPQKSREHPLKEWIEAWGYYKRRKMRSYAYEVFVRIGDHITAGSSMTDPDHADHPLVSAILKDIQSYGSASQESFLNLWNKP